MQKRAKLLKKMCTIVQKSASHNRSFACAPKQKGSILIHDCQPANPLPPHKLPPSLIPYVMSPSPSCCHHPPSRVLLKLDVSSQPPWIFTPLIYANKNRNFWPFRLFNLSLKVAVGTCLPKTSPTRHHPPPFEVVFFRMGGPFHIVSKTPKTFSVSTF